MAADTVHLGSPIETACVGVVRGQLLLKGWENRAGKCLHLGTIITCGAIRDPWNGSIHRSTHTVLLERVEEGKI